MKMDTPRVSVVRFDTRDIIATSGGGGFIPSGIDVIWLTPESVAYYNEMNANDNYDLYIDEYVSIPYFYNGVTIKSANPNPIVLAAYSETQREQYSPMHGPMPATESYTPITNQQEYKAVYDWLLARRY